MAFGTSGSVASSCSTFTANEGVYIAGAGAAGAAYIGTVVTCTGTTLTVTPATSTSVSSSNKVQHDESAAFNAALSALNTTGGTIYLPDGTYLVNGPLQDTSGANAIIPMPKVNSGQIVISIQGFTLPNWDTSAAGAIIQTSLPSGNLIGGYDSASTIPNFTSVTLDLENLTFRSYTNPGFVVVNATTLLALQAKHLLINTQGSGVTLPTNTAGAGILMPEVLNQVQNELDDVMSAGYYTGYRLRGLTQPHG